MEVTVGVHVVPYKGCWRFTCTHRPTPNLRGPRFWASPSAGPPPQANKQRAHSAPSQCIGMQPSHASGLLLYFTTTTTTCVFIGLDFNNDNLRHPICWMLLGCNDLIAYDVTIFGPSSKAATHPRQRGGPFTSICYIVRLQSSSRNRKNAFATTTPS